MLKGRARFVSWPLWLRLLVVLAFVTVLAVPAGAFLVLLVARDDSPDAATGGVIAAIVGAAFVYGYGIFYAVAPERATRHGVRIGAAYPTRAPGYPTWRDPSDTPPEPDEPDAGKN